MPSLIKACKTKGETDWEGEIALDVQAAHTVASGANIVLALAPSDSDLETGVADIVNLLTTTNFTAAGFSNAYVVSNKSSVGRKNLQLGHLHQPSP